jgi:ABC-type multidrug transport system fused ATPase/permease subunit
MIVNRLRKLVSFLSPEEKVSGAKCLILMFFMGVFDVIGVASVMPFMALVSDPEVIHTNEYLFWVYSALRFTDDRAFLMFSGLTVVALIITSTCFRAITLYKIYRFTFNREHSISLNLIVGMLNQPYSWFLNQHSSDLGKSVLFDVREVVSRCLLTIMMLLSNCSIVVLIVVMLILVDPKIAMTVFLFYSLVYVCLYLSVSKVLEKIGTERLKTNGIRYKVTSEAFSLIKDLKVLGKEDHYTSLFSEATRKFVDKEVMIQSISSLPRYGIEMVTFVGIIVTLLLSLSSETAIVEILPLLSLYAFSVYRLMPALQVIFSSITLFKASAPVLDSLCLKFAEISPRVVEDSSDKRLCLEGEILMSNVDFSYANNSKKALSGLDMRIVANQITGIIGSTGSGKTTTVDLLLGLLMADEGSLTVDGVKISKSNVWQWQKSIGYVPQQITLIDDSVAANIALGVAPEEINMDAVISAAKVSDIHEFIISELNDGYGTEVGDNGVRLSGGQRQRIGIARALYNKPDLLVLDEATSALDNETEQVVMDAVNNLGHRITIVIIAHRLSTLAKADIIYKLDKGRLHSYGSYGDLIS